VRGKIGEISIVGLVRIFHDGRQSGRLALKGPDGNAELYFADGELVNLEIDGPLSSDGPYDIFRWREGDFEITLGDFPRVHNVSIPITTFLARAEEFERRWSALARVPLGAFTLITPREPPAEATLAPADRKVLAALGDGSLLIHLAQKLEWGLAAAAESVERLWNAHAVALENVPSAQFHGAVGELLKTTLRNYEIFAGKVLAGKLIRRLKEYAARVGLGVEFRADGVAVAPAAGSDVAVGLWRSLFGFMLSEMAGPVGPEVATLLWRRSLETVGPTYEAVVSRYRLDVTEKRAGGEGE